MWELCLAVVEGRLVWERACSSLPGHTRSQCGGVAPGWVPHFLKPSSSLFPRRCFCRGKAHLGYSASTCPGKCGSRGAVLSQNMGAPWLEGNYRTQDLRGRGHTQHTWSRGRGLGVWPSGDQRLPLTPGPPPFLVRPGHWSLTDDPL
jgi:hypothetical protein